MRSTIHLVSPRDYWLFSAGVGPSREEHWLRTHGGSSRAPTWRRLAATRARAGRAALARATDLADELRCPTARRVWAGAWVELIRVPPSGTWERRRADLFRLAADWIQPETPTEEEGVEHLLRRYLAAFGPARPADAASWAGVAAARMRETAERLDLRRFRDEGGKPLVDLPRAPLPGDVPRPPRFLPTWDATLLVHARRTQILPEELPRRGSSTPQAPHSVSTFLVDGTVAGTWRVERSAAKVTLRRRAVRAPAAAPAAGSCAAEGSGARGRFHEPDATSPAVRFARRA